MGRNIESVHMRDLETGIQISTSSILLASLLLGSLLMVHLETLGVIHEPAPL